MITIDPPSSPQPPYTALSKPALTRFLNRARLATGLSGTVSVLLTTDTELQRLNRTFRGKNKPTDVLSFPASSIPGLPPQHQHAGDLAISLDTAALQAAEHHHPLIAELKILLLHGLLHLNGLDHETDSGEMAARESELRSRFRLPTSLIARTQAATPSAPSKSVIPTGGAERRSGGTRFPTSAQPPPKKKAVILSEAQRSRRTRFSTGNSGPARKRGQS